jgi:hypothetical protein
LCSDFPHPFPQHPPVVVDPAAALGEVSQLNQPDVRLLVF